MAELDKVIEGLERCIRDSEHIDDNPCFKCPYSCQCQEGYTSALKEDALELLKEQKEREKCICKEICDFIRSGCSTDTYEDQDYVCDVIQKIFIKY